MLKIIFLVLMASGLPVAIAMAGSSLIYILASGNQPGLTVIHRMIGGIDSFPLLAVPFFILAGNLMNNAGITNRIYNFALALVGWLKGGLGHVNVVGSVIFAGMSGTAIADAAGLGTVEIKAMKDHGYATEFAVGVTAASATLGPIIPPSLPFVIYAMMANVSVGALFLAGILPGVLMAVLMMVTVAYFAHKNGWGGDIKFSASRVGRALVELAVVIAWPLVTWALVNKLGLSARVVVFGAIVSLFVCDRIFKWQAVLPIMTPVLLIGGMTTGLFTPTEGAIAASAWLEDVRQGQPRHRRDHGDGHVHRRRRVDFRLDAHRHRRHRRARAMGARLHERGLGVFAAREFADAVRRLLPGADGRDHDPRAAVAADRHAVGRRSGALRPGDGAQLDDRPLAPADGHGAVRVGAGGEAERGAHDDGDLAVADSVAGESDLADLHPADRAVVAKDDGVLIE
jgi:hypothetical protein